PDGSGQLRLRDTGRPATRSCLAFRSRFVFLAAPSRPAFPETSAFQLHELDAQPISESIGFPTNASIIERALIIPRKRSVYRASARYFAGVDCACRRSRALRSLSSVRSRPRISIVSNSGGVAVLPVTATRS